MALSLCVARTQISSKHDQVVIPRSGQFPRSASNRVPVCFPPRPLGPSLEEWVRWAFFSFSGQSEIRVRATTLGNKTLMKTKQKIITAFLFVLASVISSQALDGLSIRRDDTNIVLSWPSTQYKSYAVQFKTTVDSATTWQTISDNIQANASGITYFTTGGGLLTAEESTSSEPLCGFYSVIQVPDFTTNVNEAHFDGSTFIPVDFGTYSNCLVKTEVLLNGEPTDYGQYYLNSDPGVTQQGIVIFCMRLTNGTYQLQIKTTFSINGNSAPLEFINKPVTIYVNNVPSGNITADTTIVTADSTKVTVDKDNI